MARIYDNIELKFSQGLQDIITNTGVKRVDFCVGYFNLRGWHLVCDQVDTLSGDLFDKTKFQYDKEPTDPNGQNLFNV